MSRKTAKQIIEEQAAELARLRAEVEALKARLAAVEARPWVPVYPLPAAPTPFPQPFGPTITWQSNSGGGLIH